MSSSTLLQRQQQQQLHHEQQPFDVINHPVKDTLTIVSTLLSILVHKNDSQYNPLSGSPVTLFHSRAVPRISIEAYLTRILQYIPFTNEVLLNMLVFLDRIGGLEGMHLQQGGTLESTAATSMTVTTMDAPPSLSPSLSSSPCQSISSMKQKKDPELFVGPSSSASIPSPVPCPSSLSNNSDSGFPVVQKRGREDEDLDGNQTKRTRCTVPALSITGTVTAVAFPQPPFPTPPTPAPAASAMASSNNGFKINSFNIHRLLITCLMVAAKFTSDLFYSNARYAKVGGLSLPELNQLELEFLFTTKFELNVKVDELQRVGNALLRFRERHMVRVHQVQQVQQLQMQQQQQEMLQRQLQRQYHQQQQQQMVTMSLPISPCATEAIHSDGKMPVPAPIPASVPAMTTSSTRTQLLSPPEEKHTWTGTEIQHQC
ncbi:hypothetical protein EDD11_006670 [Mortierella claussenii]|nr:hypothetical protein EDD11_006670 [Mortierella claussenii]